MTTLTVSSAPVFAAPTWPTLVRVELRKAVDTRAGRALLGTMAGLAVVILVLAAVFTDEPETFGVALSGVALPMLALLPVVGVLAVTSEWSQRSAVATFALVPRRGRVLVAKAVAVFVLDAVVAAVALVVAVVVYLVDAWVAGAPLDFAGTGRSVLMLAAVAAAATVTGLAFGSALLSTPLAITAVFVVPTVLSVVLLGFAGSAGPWLSATSWTDALFSWIQAVEPSVPIGANVTSGLLWVVLPLAIGTWRQLRREVR